jgi:hypothetical protein
MWGYFGISEKLVTSQAKLRRVFMHDKDVAVSSETLREPKSKHCSTFRALFSGAFGRASI